ncbi:MAG: hypothetical protein R6U26_00380 [Candidatus Undinarchaeales archaeon]
MYDINLSMEQYSTLVHSISGILVGLLVGFLSLDPYQVSTGILVFMAVVLYIVSGQIFQHIFDTSSKKNKQGEKKYDLKWWLANSAMVYFGFWLIAWILIYNAFLI